jgi:hypothetical protein
MRKLSGADPFYVKEVSLFVESCSKSYALAILLFKKVYYVLCTAVIYTLYIRYPTAEICRILPAFQWSKKLLSHYLNGMCCLAFHTR